MTHSNPHPYAGQTVKVAVKNHPQLADGEHPYRIEDWWDNLGQGSWQDQAGNPACILYAIHVVKDDLPIDEEAVYGKVGAFGHLIHVSEFVLDENGNPVVLTD